MRKGDAVYFAPQISWSSVNINSRNQLIRQYSDRINGFYLEPAKVLLELDSLQNSFAAGIILLSAIDSMGRITMHGGDSIEYRQRVRSITHDIVWSNYNLSESVQNEFIEILTANFRNGLIHEGRIKNFQFTDNSNFNLFEFEGNMVIINSLELLKFVVEIVDNVIEMLERNDDKFSIFKSQFEKDFKDELKMA